MVRLSQKDRDILSRFFDQEYDWMSNTNLLTAKNLSELERKFVTFIQDNNCQENSCCKLFLETIDNELKQSKMRKQFTRPFHNKTRLNSVIRTMQDSLLHGTNNPRINMWIEESRTITVDITPKQIVEINQSIKLNLPIATDGGLDNILVK